MTRKINGMGKEKKPAGYWTKERVFEEARKYKTRSEFGKNLNQPYHLALKNGWLDEMDWFQKFNYRQAKWTEEEIRTEAKKYNTRTEFHDNKSSVYKKALKLGILDQLFPKKQTA